MHHFTIHFYDIVSIVGVVIILITYLLLQCDMLASSSYSYSILNIIGSFMILYSLAYDWNLSAVIIESSWILISLIGIYRQMRPQKKLSHSK